MESSPQISAHDLITLCKLEHKAIHYAPPTPSPNKNHNNPLLWKHLENARNDSVIVLDIRKKEEYP